MLAFACLAAAPPLAFPAASNPAGGNRLTLTRSALLTARGSPPPLAAAPHLRARQRPQALPGEREKQGVTFSADIAPILFTHCAACHRPGEVAPFSLLTYGDAKRRAAQIASVTARRIMPPWKPEPGYGDFIGARRLSDEEIGAIQQWVQQGAVEGDPADLPPRPVWPDGWQLGTPDLVVGMPEPYTLAAAGGDVFRTFVVPAPVATTRYVRALEFRSSGMRVVHHASIRIDKTSSSRQLDERDPLPGYEGIISREASFPEGYFLSWTPGQLPQVTEPEMAWRLDPGTDFVLQIHLRPSGKPESVQASLGLFFAEEPPTLKPAVLRLSKQSIDIPAGSRAHVVEDSYVLPVDVDVRSVQPHAHYRARQVRAWAQLPDGTRTWLIRIEDWDFAWQDVYRYRQPLHLPKGATLFMRYSYDNSADNPRNPARPPERVIWGQRSTDEMGDLWLQVLTRTEEERAALTRDMRRKIAREDIEGYKKLLSVEPDNPGLHDDLGLLYVEAGDVAGAVAQFQTVVELKPASPAAHYNLGMAFALGGRLAEARERYDKALELDPAYLPARNSLGGLLVAQGELDEAIGQLREALRLDPHHAEAHNNLGIALMQQDKVEDALLHLRQALESRPEYAEARYNTGIALAMTGREIEAAGEFREAVRLKPDWPSALADLARLLATSADPALRDPVEAVTLAERAAALAHGQGIRILDALATAYAAAGRFDRAVAAAESALQQATAGNVQSAIPEIKTRLDFYRRQQAAR